MKNVSQSHNVESLRDLATLTLATPYPNRADIRLLARRAIWAAGLIECMRAEMEEWKADILDMARDDNEVLG